MALDTQTNVDKEINEGILRTYLGVDDPIGIDFGTYKTLLREKIAAARMGGGDMDSSDISYLTNEFIRIKKIEVPEGQAKKKIDINKFVKKAEEKKKSDTKSAQKLFNLSPVKVDSTKRPSVNSQKLLPPDPDLDESQNIDSDFAQSIRDEFDSKLDDVINDVQNIADDFDKRLDDLLEDIRNDKDEKQAVIDDLKSENEEQKKALKLKSLSLPTLAENLEEILGNTREQTKLREDAVKQADKIEQTTERKDREAKLESKTPKVGNTVKKAEKATKPMGGFLDMILNFFKNILLGGALVALMNIIENPGKMLNPIINNINGFIDFINNALEKIFTVLLFIPNKMIDNFNFGIGFITDRINDAINLFGGDPIEKFQVPNLEPPQIPKIPLLEEGGETEMPAAGAEGGGMVPAMQEGGVVFSPIVNMTTPKFNSGGVVNSFKMDAPKYNSGGVVNNLKMDTPRFIGGGSVNQNINPQRVNNFSYASGGSITSNSGQKVSGMGADTQLIAAQPGEMVMSKSAVNYWGAGNLLAMNKEGGGTNKPKMGKVRGFSGGGMIEVKGTGNTVEGDFIMKDSAGKQVGPKYLAISGTYAGMNVAQKDRSTTRNAPMPDGTYPVMGFEEHGSYPGLPGIGHWSAYVNNSSGSIGTRSGLMIHNDINDDGTLGCIGVGLGGAAGSKAEQDFLKYWKQANPTSMKVALGSNTRSGGSSGSASPTPPRTATVDNSSKKAASVPSQPSAPAVKATLIPPIGDSSPKGSNSASNAGQTRVDGFSPIDMNNPELIVIKSIYNVVG